MPEISNISTGRHVARNADAVVEFHDIGRNRALEAVDARHLPEHGGVVGRLVEVAAHVLQIVNLNFIARIENVLVNRMGCAAGKRRVAEHKQRRDKRRRYHADTGGDKETRALCAEFFVKQHQRQQARERENHVNPEARFIRGNANTPFLHLVLLRHQRHEAYQHRKSEGNARRPVHGAFPVGFAVLDGAHGRQRKEQHRNIEPARVINGEVQKLEHAVERRNGGKQHEQHHQLFEPVAPAQL